MIILLSLLIGDCSPSCASGNVCIDNRCTISCTTDAQCVAANGTGQICVDGGCTQPQSQAIAACSCRCGEAPTCAQSGNLAGTGSSSGSGWGNCSCSEGFQPSLRLVFRWEPADTVKYSLPPSPYLAIPNTGATPIPDAQVRATITQAFANWSPTTCPGGGAPILHAVNSGVNFDPKVAQNGLAFARTTGLPTPYDSCKTCPMAQDFENRIGMNTTLGPCDRPCLGQIGPDPTNQCKVDGLVCTYDSTVLATTPVLYASTQTNILGRLYRAGTMVNAKNFHWRTTSGGCNPNTDNACYDLLVTLTHEFGHFFGYMHTSCAASVMYGTADPSTGQTGNRETVVEADLASLCGEGNCSTLGYPGMGDTKVPMYVDSTGTTIDTSGALLARFASCKKTGSTDPCAPSGRLACITTNVTDTGIDVQGGFCSITCSDTTNSVDCPVGEQCVSNGTVAYCAVSSKVRSCVPQATTDPSCNSGGTTGSTTGSTTTGGTTTGGTTGSGTTGLDGSTTDTPASGGAFTDFCAPCTGHADCSTGDCVDLGNGTNICTGPCESDIDCPNTPASADGSVAAVVSTCVGGDGANGGFCYPADTSCVAAAAASRRALNEECDQSSLCAPGLLCVQLNNAAVCLEYCDPNGTNACATDGYSCVKIDDTHEVGVCFKATAHEGDGCALPDTSLCGLSGNLICAGTADNSYADAKCYALCGGSYGNCSNSAQTCLAFPNSATGVCSPISVSQCLGDLGQSCVKSADCQGGLCQIVGTESGCTRSCKLSTESGCPTNFDCKDGGAGNDKGYCWPHDNTLTKPKCPTASSGCGCHSGGGLESLFTAAAVALVLARRRRRCS